MTKNTLGYFVETEMLQEVQERFSAATGLGAIIADAQGQPLTSASNFTSFCTKMRSNEKGAQCCVMSDRDVGIKAAQQAKPVVHYCHAGLIDVAAPIVINGEHLGSVLCGQVLFENQDAKQLKFIGEKSKELGIDQKLMQRYFEKIELTTQKRIDSTLYMLQIVADYIEKMAVNRSMGRELAEQSKQLINEMEIQSRLEAVLQEMKLKVLESQITPHFLFDTLNTISRIAYLENAEQTQDVTYALAKMMRYSLRDSTDQVTLKEELDYIHNYLTIQRSRYRNQIHYEECMEINTEGIKVPILSLQPIIESAIKKGLEHEEKDVHIKLSGYVSERRIVLEITDSNHAVPEEKRTGHVMGSEIISVQRRLEYYYGEEVSVKTIANKKGASPTIQILLPVSGGVYV